MCRQMHIRRRNLSVCIAARMVEKTCHKCNYIAKSNWHWQQHLNRSTPCDAGKFECSKGCGKPLKRPAANMRRTAEVLTEPWRRWKLGNRTHKPSWPAERKQASWTWRLLAKHPLQLSQSLSLTCRATLVLDINKLKLHHAIGKEATRHLREKNTGLQLSASPGAHTLVKWFWLLRGRNEPANHNIMLMRGDSPHTMIHFEEVWKRLDIEEALWTVFRADAIKLYDFPAREAESYEGVNHERVYTFRMDFVLSRCMNEAKSGGINGELFSHWKQAVAEQLHQVTLELYAEEATKSVASAMDYSRQQTYASNLQEIRKMQEMVRELQHKQEILLEENILLSKPQGFDV